MMAAQHALDKFYAFLSEGISYPARVVLALCCVPLLMSLTQPLWRISMEAPQYPNGLWMEIYTHTLRGGNNDQHLSEINELNHYIGMHAIDIHDLSELGWMPFAIGLLAILTLRVAAIGDVRAMIDLTVMTFYVFGFLAARFAYRLYSYGHNLEPTAAFKIAPFTPAILGTKQIMNFTTHSYPRLGTIYLLLFMAAIASITLWQLLAGRRRAMSRPSWPVSRPST
jgi:copper chaperone NosL